MGARRGQQRGHAKVRRSRCRRRQGYADVAVRVAGGRRAAGDRACEGRVLIQSRRWRGVRHPRPPRLGPRPRICTLDHVSLQFYSKSTSLTVDVLCRGVLLLLHHHLFGPWSLLQRGGLRSAGAVGTPARCVLFESHRDGRVCRVARDSSSSDSNLLPAVARAIFRSRSRLLATKCARDRSRAVGRTLALPRERVYLGLRVNDHARSSTYPGTRVRVQDCGSRSSECPRSFARISGRGKSPTIVSLNLARYCLVDILRRGPSILPAGLSDVFSDLSPWRQVPSDPMRCHSRGCTECRETSESSAFGAPDLTETKRYTGTWSRRGAGALASGHLRWRRVIDLQYKSHSHVETLVASHSRP